MTFFKSIILLVFCIGWVKAIQYNDVNNEFNKIFHQVKQSIDDAWRWMRTQANRSLVRLNEVFTMRRPTEQGRHKYQDVIPPNTEALKPENEFTELEKAPLSQSTENTKNPVTTIASTPEIKSSTPPQELDTENPDTTIVTTPEVELTTPPQESNTTVDPSESANPPESANQPESGNPPESANLPESANPPESANLQEEKQNEAESNPEEVQKPTEQPEPEPECDDSTTEEPTTNIQGVLILQTQTEAEIPLEGEHIANKLESPALQEIIEGNSRPIQSDFESDSKLRPVGSSAEKEKAEQDLESDKVESAESETKMETLASIYSQQSVLIKILCCIVILLALRSIFSLVETEILHRDSGIVIAAIGSWKKTPTVSVVKSEHLIKSEK